MLLSERQERERRFKLALRAGIPVLLLVSLVLYSTFFKGDTIKITFENTVIISAIIFITVYFIYFLIDISVKETLVDHTTQGFNQKAFITQLEESKPEAIALLVIENLSTISENYSSEDVDLLLYTVVHKLDAALKHAGLKKSIIARRHGAEFLIAIDKNQEDIEKVFKDFMHANRSINNIALSYDFAVITNTTEELQHNIIQLKDMITTQQNIPNAEKVSSLVKDAKEVSEVERSIIDSIQKQNLNLSFRPLLHVQTNKIDMYEISVKLPSSQGEDILPRVFLPIINRLGMGRTYDITLVQHILVLLPKINEGISLSFNLSPFSLRDTQFQEQFFTYLEKSKVDPSRLIIELYERKAHHDLSAYLKTLNLFREKGIRIAIDNFGSSSASMEYMKNFNFDIVQFDRDYVTKLEDSNTHTMLSSMITMSKDLHVTTVAKWVDNETQKKKLKALGIDYMQGFGIAKIISEEALIKSNK